MFITKMALSRRMFLRGMGATIALPMLDSMVPALSAAGRTAKTVPRLGFFYVPHSVTKPLWTPKGEAATFELGPIMAPLTPVKHQTLVVRGLSNYEADARGVGGGSHERAQSTFLSGVRAKLTEGPDFQLGITADQIAAAELGKETPLRSLELKLDPTFLIRTCERYSCVYGSTMSWRSATLPNQMENNPRMVFERLFGDGGNPDEQQRRLRQERSILDLANEGMQRLQAKLGASDRVMVSEYLDAVREVEQRIQRAERQGASSLAGIDKPVGIPDEYAEHARLMLDLLLLAYRTDTTRVSTFAFQLESNQGKNYPEIGVPEAHHEMSHHGNDPHKIQQQTKINIYHMELFGEFVRKLHSTPDGDGSLLDHAMLLYGSGLGEGDLHQPLDLPVAVVGGGGGKLRGGRALSYSLETPFTNLLVTLLGKVGVKEKQIGDSNGELSEV